MLFGEPARTQADLNFSLGNIPVRVHPFFWLIGLFLGPLQAGVREMVVWLVAFFLGILLHEMGHALMMQVCGFRPWVILYGMGGMAVYNPGATWNSRGNTTGRQILISAAGPGAGFLLAAVIVGTLLLTGYGVEVRFGLPYGVAIWLTEQVGSIWLTRLIFDLLFVTVVYGVLNLMPIYPLDGGKIARDVCLRINPHEGIRWSLILSMVVAAALAALAAKAALSGRQGAYWFTVLLFGYLAFTSYSTMQAYENQRPG